MKAVYKSLLSLPPLFFPPFPSNSPTLSTVSPFVFYCSTALLFLFFVFVFDLIERKMGVSDKLQVEAAVAFDLDGKKWLIAGISPKVSSSSTFSSSLKPITTTTTTATSTTKRRLPGKQMTAEEEEVAEVLDDFDDEACSTTPTGEESRIPTQLSCPPAPRKHRPPSSKCRLTRAAVEFFTPPDLESVFVHRVEPAS